jgi:hypothetical protein
MPLVICAGAAMLLEQALPDATIHLRPANNRAGKNKIARNKAKQAPMVMPIRRKGSEINQTSGKSSKASRATGQQSTNKIHQRMSRISAFIANPFLARKQVRVHYKMAD